MSRKILLSITALVALVMFLTGIFLWYYVQHTGHNSSTLRHYPNTAIHQNMDGSFTVKASDWTSAIEAQGFIVAGERMFQMELMRRKADGALSELFGQSALSYDQLQRSEDWRFYATKAYHSMPLSQRKACDAFASGVNEFSSHYPNQVNIEYKILRKTPQTWSCVDSLLIALLMSDDMSHSWEKDFAIAEWKEKLPSDWYELLIPTNHPWNKLWFENPNHVNRQLAIPQTTLPASSLSPEQFAIDAETPATESGASNSWAYRGTQGAWLANDPHLGNQVPQLWIPMRIEFEPNHFVVGTALPGVPGILIGMNEHLAWSITNTGEDVDHGIIEPVDALLSETVSEIKINNQRSVFIKQQKTANGPVVKKSVDGKFIVRKWISLAFGNLSIPSELLALASNWDEFNQAIDEFKFVPLNFTMLDNNMNMGLRVSGCDILVNADTENVNSNASLNATNDQICGTENRRRLYKPYSQNTASDFISTANEQLWDDGKFHNWADDDRAYRIREALNSSSNLTLNDMRLLQLDTKSRFHQNILSFLIKNGDLSIITAEQAREWLNWNGDAQLCDHCMTEADAATRIFDKIIIEKAIKSFNISPSDESYGFKRTKRGRVLKFIEQESLFDSMGIDKKELVNGILAALNRDKFTPRKWSQKNANTTQHPFVGRVPVIGKLFALEPYPQFGSLATVRAEKHNYGPSMRLIWNLQARAESLWAFPIGVSGHPTSKFYQSWLKNWQAGAMSTVPQS